MQRAVVCALFCILLLGSASASIKCKCLPGDPCWPTQFSWALLNITVGGRLLGLEPVAETCYNTSNHYDPARCAEVTQNYQSIHWRIAEPAALQTIALESFRNKDCPPPALDPSATVCFQGSVPIYAINATTWRHIQAGVLFAQLHNLRLVFKSTGHDFLGRSTAAGSLLIWTHAMKNMTYAETFDNGCRNPSWTGPVVTVQSGVLWSEAYAFAQQFGKALVGGASASVSAAGGYVQGGGHGPLAPLHGLAADNVVEFEVITSLGLHLTVTECQYADLFWAMRGGAPGFAGIVSVTYRAHPSPTMTLSSYSMASTNKTSWIRAVAALAQLQPSLSDEGWIGSYSMSHTKSSISFIAPNCPPATMTAKTNATLQFIKNLPGINFTVSTPTPIQFPNYNTWFAATYAPKDYIFPWGVYGTRLIPRSVHQNNALALAEAIWDSGAWIASSIAGGKVSTFAGDSAGANPAWRQALWEVLIEIRWNATTPYSEIQQIYQQITAQTQILRNVTPGGGTYANEVDPHEPNWQQALYGTNYPRLLRIKNIWDPTDLFLCTMCVGSEGWDLEISCRD